MAVSVRATGVRFDQADAGPTGSPSPERRAEDAAWRRGELVYLTVTAFVEFNDESGEQRWVGTPQGPYAVPLGKDATSLLLELAERPDDLLADLGISGEGVPRFDFYAAPRRIELQAELRQQLLLR
jgi:hypothetical protein